MYITCELADWLRLPNENTAFAALSTAKDQYRNIFQSLFILIYSYLILSSTGRIHLPTFMR